MLASSAVGIECPPMPPAKSKVETVLDVLERHYGPQQAGWPTSPYEFIVWWHCGYPPSDERCARGWESLTKAVGTSLEALLAAPMPKLTAALKPGGMVPELRAMRLKEIAMRIQDEFAGDLRGALSGSLAEAKKQLKKFPNIADAGADRILLFAGIAPVAAVASNCPQVLARILYGREHENYARTYKEAQQAVEAEIPAKLDARQRAYLLLKRHGQELCKRTKPKCEACPLSKSCACATGKDRGRDASAARIGSRR